MTNSHAYTLSDIISQLHIRFTACRISEFTEEWAEDVQALSEAVDAYTEELTNQQPLKDEIRQKIAEGLLNEPGLKQYSNWLQNTLIAPTKNLLIRLDEASRDPNLSPKNKELRNSIPPPDDIELAEKINRLPLSEADREAVLQTFLKVLRLLRSATHSIRQVAEQPLKQVTHTYYVEPSSPVYHEVLFLAADKIPAANSPMAKSKNRPDEPRPQRKQQGGTKKRHQEYVSDVLNFESIEGKGRVAAIASAAEKNGVSCDTIERALGIRK